jgi:capsular polysaccharide biosynthesis protein
MKNKREEISFKDIIDVLLPKIWIIAIVAIVFGAFSFVYSSFIKNDTYTSSGIIYVYSDSDKNATTGDLDVAKGMVEVYKVYLRSDKFLSYVVANLNDKHDYTLTTSDIKGMVSISQEGEVEIFNISITTTDQRLAYNIAQEVVTLLPERIENDIPNGLAVTIIDPPKLGGLNSKNEIRNTFIGVIAGALISMVVIWVYSIFDVKIRSVKKLEDNFDIPVLGIIPKYEVAPAVKEENK